MLVAKRRWFWCCIVIFPGQIVVFFQVQCHVYEKKKKKEIKLKKLVLDNKKKMKPKRSWKLMFMIILPCVIASPYYKINLVLPFLSNPIDTMIHHVRCRVTIRSWSAPKACEFSLACLFLLVFPWFTVTEWCDGCTNLVMVVHLCKKRGRAKIISINIE